MAVLAARTGALGAVSFHIDAGRLTATLAAGLGYLLRIVGEAVFAVFMMGCHGLSSSMPLTALIAAFRALPGAAAEHVAAALAGVIDTGPGLPLGAMVGRMRTASGCVHAAPLALVALIRYE